MNWIPVNTYKPKLGQKCYCYFVMERYDGSVLKDTRLLYYLKYRYDKRKRVFSSKSSIMELGGESWPVTHWIPEPNPPKEYQDENHRR